MSNLAPVRIVIALVLVVLAVPTAAFAEVKNWDGQAGDGLWSTNANWDPNGPTTTSDDVEINQTNGIDVILDTEGDEPIDGPGGFPIALKDVRTLKIGTGSQAVKLVFAGTQDAGTGLSFAAGPPSSLSLEIGAYGTVETHGATLVKPGTEGEVSVENRGTIRVFAPTFQYVKIEGPFAQTSQGNTEIHLPVTRDLVDGADPNALFAALGGMTLAGDLRIYSPDPSFVPTPDVWPTTVPFRLLNYSQNLTKTNLAITFNDQGINVNGGRISYSDPNTNRVIAAELFFGQDEAAFRAAVLGDMNGDGILDSLDISLFEMALADPATYDITFPMIDRNFVGDINNDGVMNAFDIFAFEQLLIAQGLQIDPGVFLLMMELFAEE